MLPERKIYIFSFVCTSNVRSGNIACGDSKLLFEWKFHFIHKFMVENYRLNVCVSATVRVTE